VVGVKNYITPNGLQRLKDERRFLLTRERPAVTQVVAWAASNGDRSENADYQYGKRRLREIDRRIRFLIKRIDAAEVVDPEAPRSGRSATQVLFFGATVRYANAAGTKRVVSIVGLDEVDLAGVNNQSVASAVAWMRARSALDALIARSSASSDWMVMSAAALLAAACSTAREITSALVAPAFLPRKGFVMR
jgi:transcription elongation factor GreB